MVLKRRARTSFGVSIEAIMIGYLAVRVRCDTSVGLLEMMYFEMVCVEFCGLYFKEFYLCEYGCWVEGTKYDAAFNEVVVSNPEVGSAVPYGSLLGVGRVLKGVNTLNFT